MQAYKTYLTDDQLCFEGLTLPDTPSQFEALFSNSTLQFILFSKKDANVIQEWVEKKELTSSLSQKMDGSRELYRYVINKNEKFLLLDVNYSRPKNFKNAIKRLLVEIQKKVKRNIYLISWDKLEELDFLPAGKEIIVPEIAPPTGKFNLLPSIQDKYWGESPEHLQLCRQILKFSQSEPDIYILGETGTGKEVLARLIHELGPNPTGPFIDVNCSAISESLFESEMFGHEKGSFTGADSLKKGKIEQADGGTLFLDEVGDFPMPLQSKLLRVLQEREVTRVGGSTSIPLSFRVVSATHKNLKNEIDNHRFREDLYFRIAALQLKTYPLRNYPMDLNMRARKKWKNLYPDGSLNERVLEKFVKYEWPGNNRQLFSFLDALKINSESSHPTVEDILTTFNSQQITMRDKPEETRLDMDLNQQYLSLILKIDTCTKNFKIMLRPLFSNKKPTENEAIQIRFQLEKTLDDLESLCLNRMQFSSNTLYQLVYKFKHIVLKFQNDWLENKNLSEWEPWEEEYKALNKTLEATLFNDRDRIPNSSKKET